MKQQKERVILTLIGLFLILLFVSADRHKWLWHHEAIDLMSVLMIVTQSVLLIFAMYQIVIAIAGLLPKKRPANKEDKKLPRFLCITAAHNEEAVIGEHVKNLQSLHYPKELYDIVVLADNCNDSTAEIVHSLGATAWERFNMVEKGKGYALKWALHEKADLNAYDGVCIFDADNLLDLNFLSVMAKRLMEGHHAIQGYLDSKNPWDSWVSASYASAYWYMNRFWQRARIRIGLSGALGGTGFCISTEALRKNPWQAMSLTEDLEYTMRLILNNDKVFFTDETKVYDEKPVDYKATIPQRTRWLQGHWDTAFHYSGQLMKKIFTSTGMKSYRAFDALVYLWQPVLILLTAINLIAMILKLTLGGSWYHPWLSEYIPTTEWTCFVIVGLLMPLLAFTVEKSGWKSFVYFPLFLIFNLSWIPVTISGYLRRKEKTWSHTQHKRSIGFEEISGVGKGEAENG